MRRLFTSLCLLLCLFAGPAWPQSVTPSSPIGTVVSSAIASGSAVSIATSTVTINVTSVALGPGTYLCSGGVNFINSTAVTQLAAGLTPTSATPPGFDGNVFLSATFAATNQNVPIGSIVITETAASTTIWMYAQETFAAGTHSAYGTLDCVRILNGFANMAAFVFPRTPSGSIDHVCTRREKAGRKGDLIGPRIDRELVEHVLIHNVVLLSAMGI
jgi:hypothetical protein